MFKYSSFGYIIGTIIGALICLALGAKLYTVIIITLGLWILDLSLHYTKKTK